MILASISQTRLAPIPNVEDRFDTRALTEFDSNEVEYLCEFFRIWVCFEVEYNRLVSEGAVELDPLDTYVKGLPIKKGFIMLHDMVSYVRGLKAGIYTLPKDRITAKMDAIRGILTEFENRCETVTSRANV